MSDTINIERSVDIEGVLKAALAAKFTVYVRPLPETLTLPCVEVQQVGGSREKRLDTFTIKLDSRAAQNDEATAIEQLNNAVGYLIAVAEKNTTAIRAVTINAAGSWGQDPARPDLSMATATLLVCAHQERTTL
jgi:hypothetical protein